MLVQSNFDNSYCRKQSFFFQVLFVRDYDFRTKFPFFKLHWDENYHWLNTTFSGVNHIIDFKLTKFDCIFMILFTEMPNVCFYIYVSNNVYTCIMLLCLFLFCGFITIQVILSIWKLCRVNKCLSRQHKVSCYALDISSSLIKRVHYAREKSVEERRYSGFNIGSTLTHMKF